MGEVGSAMTSVRFHYREPLEGTICVVMAPRLGTRRKNIGVDTQTIGGGRGNAQKTRRAITDQKYNN